MSSSKHWSTKEERTPFIAWRMKEVKGTYVRNATYWRDERRALSQFLLVDSYTSSTKDDYLSFIIAGRHTNTYQLIHTYIETVNYCNRVVNFYNLPTSWNSVLQKEVLVDPFSVILSTKPHNIKDIVTKPVPALFFWATPYTCTSNPLHMMLISWLEA